VFSDLALERLLASHKASGSLLFPGRLGRTLIPTLRTLMFIKTACPATLGHSAWPLPGTDPWSWSI